MSSLCKEVATARQCKLLGSLAYVIDAAAFKYVFPDKQGHLSIKEINDASKHEELSEEQKHRWKKFAAFLQHNGWSVFQLIMASSILQKLHYVLVHVSEAELQEVIVEQLQQLAGELLKPKELPTFNRLMALAANFAIETSRL